jgi:hypothetical protein
VRAVAATDMRSASDELQRLLSHAPVELIPPAAALHRVEGTMLSALEDVAGVPDDVLEQLSALRERARLHHLMVTAQLSLIGRELERAGVQWVVMKGPVVASLLYPDPGDRRYSDLDIMVARPDFPAAMAVLEALGFQHSIHNWALAEQMLAGQVEMKAHAVTVDLHWHLHYSAADRSQFALDPEAMIARRRHVGVSGVTVPALDPVDTLLTLAFHAARSDGHRLVWLKDIERSLAVERPDLDELIRRCRSSRCGPPVGVMLRRAHELLGAEVPHEVVDSLTGRALRIVDTIVTRTGDPVQFHDRPTMTRAFTRSVRSSLFTSISAGPGRVARSLKRRLIVPPENETDDPMEKARYLRAVVESEG